VTRWRAIIGCVVVGAPLLCGSAVAAGEPDDGLVTSAEDVSPALVGTSVPDGAVKTEDGQETTLEDLRAGRPAVLVFYRGHW
jgi:cytochrome oxidase Cu insertion factor (SCO1/SenC/PrrC family)